MKFFQINEPKLSFELESFLKEEKESTKKIEKKILKMINEIKRDDFKAIQKYSKKFDNFNLTKENVKVTKNEIEELSKKIKKELAEALEIAVERVKTFHKKEKLESFSFTDSEKNKMGQKIIPLESVGIYIPGGGALYPSTFYMCAIPAIIAGVKRIAVFSPPNTFINSPELAFLLKLLNINEVYRIGGAQAIITAAYGIKNIPKVDKIVGPGNIYVATAKRLVYGEIDIDMIAGPSEILVIADTNKEEDIPWIASDLLSQAEHPPGGYAKAILIGTNKEYLLKIREEIYKQAKLLPNPLTAIESLNKRGAIICCPDILIAIEIANIIAPEHLELFSDNANKLIEHVKNAGSVFLGKFTPECVGDYIGGPNHVLPTSGTARFFSPLGVYDFQKRFSWIEFSKDSLYKYKNYINLIATSEKLYAHGKSALIRFNTE